MAFCQGSLDTHEVVITEVRVTVGGDSDFHLICGEKFNKIATAENKL